MPELPLLFPAAATVSTSIAGCLTRVSLKVPVRPKVGLAMKQRWSRKRMGKRPYNLYRRGHISQLQVLSCRFSAWPYQARKTVDFGLPVEAWVEVTVVAMNLHVLIGTVRPLWRSRLFQLISVLSFPQALAWWTFPAVCWKFRGKWWRESFGNRPSTVTQLAAPELSESLSSSSTTTLQ